MAGVEVRAGTRVAGWLIGAFALACATLVSAQDYPTRAVRMMIPFAPGGATDITGRLLAQQLSEVWGQPIVIENRGGAAGNIAAAEMAKATPDGYSLFFTSGSVITANEHIYQGSTVRPERDFVAISSVARGPQVIVVPADSSHKSLRDLIAAARQKPGGLSYGHAGVGSQTHLAAENFLAAAKLEIQHIPYKGEGPALTDVVAGRLDLATPNLAAAIGFMNQGKLRALAVTSLARAEQAPDVPTVAETVPGFENNGWFGVVAPAGTPRPIVEKVHRDIVRALDSAAVRGRFFVQGMTVATSTPADFDKQIRTERAMWARVVAERRITVK